MDRPRGCYSGVFEVFEAIPEIGAAPGDRIVVRPWDPERYCSLVRRLPCSASRLVVEDGRTWLCSTVPEGMASAPFLRYLREHLGIPDAPAEPRGRRSRRSAGHLQLV